MKQPTRDELADYYQQAGSWANERLESVRASRRTAWIVAIIAVLIALAEAIALMLLTPLKTVVPYTLLVDRQTGHVQALDPIRTDRIAPDTALTQSFLVQYVIAREGFDIGSVQQDYKKVSLWSAETARSDYVGAMQVGHPESPLTRYPRSSIVDVKIRSVSPLGKNAALVRFETARRDKAASPQLPQSWIATVTFRYSDQSMATEDRFINPLGFQVVRYRKSAETPPMVQEEAAPGGRADVNASPPSRVVPLAGPAQIGQRP